jgi:mutator protein MutT
MNRDYSSKWKDLAGCVILNEASELLLLNRVRDEHAELELPGGKVETGEQRSSCAIRETREETGLDVEIVKFLGNEAFSSREIRYQYYWYQGIIKSGQPAVMEPDKHNYVGYFNLFDRTLDIRAISQNMHNLLTKVRSGELVFDSV